MGIFLWARYLCRGLSQGATLKFECRVEGWCLKEALHINVQRFRGGLVFKAHRLLYHSTVGLRGIKKKTPIVNP